MRAIFVETITNEDTKKKFIDFVEKYKLDIMGLQTIDCTKPSEALRAILDMKDKELQKYLLSYTYIRQFDKRPLLREMVSRCFLTKEQKEVLLSFYKISDTIKLDYEAFKTSRTKKRYEESKILENVLDPCKLMKIFSEFDSKNYKTTTQFLHENGLLKYSCEEVLNFLSRNNLTTEFEKLNALKEKSLERCTESFLKTKYKVTEAYNYIMYGQIINGERVPYTMLDYYENYTFTKAEFLKYLKMYNLRITSEVHSFFKYSKYCSQDELMSTKYIINNVEISEETKLEAINYLKKKHIPLSPLLFHQALKKVK